MRKVSLFAASCIALVAFLGLSAQAFALTDPDCDGNPYNNDALIHEFTIDTSGSHLEHQVSGVGGGALACGTDIGLFGSGSGTLYNHADVSTPPGVVVGNTSGIPTGSYAGSATVSVLYHLFGTPQYAGNQVSTLTIDVISKCQSETAFIKSHPSHPTGDIVACYKGTSALGTNWNWTHLNATTGRYSLIVGPMHAALGITPGLTRVSLNLCDYPGTVGGSSCGGGSNQWLQINGDASAPDCNGGQGPNGIYKVSATNNNSQTTPEASSCVVWNAAKGKKNIDIPPDE